MPNNKNLTEQAIEGSFWGAASTFLERAGTLIFSIILARLLVPENFGVYSLTMSIALIFMTFADLGLDHALVRYLSSNINNKKKVAAYFQYLFKIKFLLSFIVSFALLITAYPLSFWIYKQPQLFLPLIMASIFILTSLFVYFFSSFFYAVKKVKYVGIKEIFFQLIRIIITTFIFIFLTSVYHLLGIFTGLIFTNLIIILILLFWIRKFDSYIFKKSYENIEKLRVIKFLSFITIGSISGIFFTYIDTLMLGFFVSLTYIAYYKVAFNSVFAFIGLFAFLGFVFMPIFANIKGKRLNFAINKVLRFLLIFTIPSTFFALIFGKYLITLLYGYNYILSSFPFYILSFMIITYTPIVIMSSLFFSKEKPKYPVKVTVVSLILNIVFNYILISQLVKISELLALVGAATATIISRYIMFFYLFSLAKKEINISIEKINFVRPIFAGLIMLLTLGAINSFIVKDMNLLIGIIEIFFGMLVYFSIMFLIKGFGIEDIEIIKKFLISKRK